MDDQSLVYNYWRMRRTALQVPECVQSDRIARFLSDRCVMIAAISSVKMSSISHSISSKTRSATSLGRVAMLTNSRVHKHARSLGRSSENKPSRSHLNILVSHNDDPTNMLIVRFCDAPKIGVAEIKDYYRRMEEENVSSTILVVQKGLTSQARSVSPRRHSPSDRTIARSLLDRLRRTARS